MVPILGCRALKVGRSRSGTAAFSWDGRATHSMTAVPRPPRRHAPCAPWRRGSSASAPPTRRLSQPHSRSPLRSSRTAFSACPPPGLSPRTRRRECAPNWPARAGPAAATADRGLAARARGPGPGTRAPGHQHAALTHRPRHRDCPCSRLRPPQLVRYLLADPRRFRRVAGRE